MILESFGRLDDRITDRYNQSRLRRGASWMSGEQHTRRTVLNSVGAGAVGVTGIGTLSDTTTGDDSDESVEIVTAYRGDRPLIKKSVPRDWWSQRKRCEQVAERLKRQYLYTSSISGITSVGVGATNRRITGRQAGCVIVGVHPDGTDATLPNEIRGIPVTVQERSPH